MGSGSWKTRKPQSSTGRVYGSGLGKLGSGNATKQITNKLENDVGDHSGFYSTHQFLHHEVQGRNS